MQSTKTHHATVYRSEYSGTVNYWILYDAFLAWELAEKERESGEVEVVPVISIEEKGRSAAQR